MTLRRIAILSLLLAIGACGAGAWLSMRGLTGAFVAPGAANVRVDEIRPGEREITYTMPNPADGWQTAIARRLSFSGWRLDAEHWQWGGPGDGSRSREEMRSLRVGCKGEHPPWA